jgi:hypothetical protein
MIAGEPARRERDYTMADFGFAAFSVFFTGSPDPEGKIAEIPFHSGDCRVRSSNAARAAGSSGSKCRSTWTPSA